MRSAIRYLPSLLVATLLVLVARAQPLARPDASPGQAYAPRAVSLGSPTQCAPATLCPGPACQGASMTSMLALNTATELVQTMRLAVAVSQTVVLVSPTSPLDYLLRVRLFDPQSPTPFGASMPFDVWTEVTTTAHWVNRQFRRPLVFTCVEGVAQPTQPSSTSRLTATTITLTSGSGDIGASSSPISTDATPLGYYVDASGAHLLPSSSPYLAHEVCGAGFDEQQRRVLQQVLKSTGLVGVTATAEVVQSFVAPVSATAEWVELAIASKPAAPPPMQVSIFDPGALTVPPPGPMPVTATSATLDVGGSLSVPSWVPTLHLTQPASLEAGKTYWIAVKTSNQWGLAADGSGGAGDPQGKLFTRPNASGSWTEDTGKDLSIRVIGLPIDAPVAQPVTCTAGAVVEQVTATATVLCYAGHRIAQKILPGDLAVETSSFLVAHAVTASAQWPVLGMAFNQATGEAPDDGTYLMSAHQIPPTSTAAFVTITHRPIVTAHMSGTASDPLPGWRYVWHMGHLERPAEIHMDPGSSVQTAASAQEEIAPGCWQDLPGLHPVLAVRSCAATSPDAADLRAVQQFLPVNETMSPTATAEIVQTFRVPAACLAEWVELAISPGQTWSRAFTVEIEEQQPNPPGPGPLPVTTTATTLDPGHTTDPNEGQWMPTLRFSNPAYLDPTRTYWLVVRADNQLELGLNAVTATAYSDGNLYTRPVTTTAFIEDPVRDLSFRIIGVAAPPLGAPAPSRLLSLTVISGPNPFGVSHSLRWSGGSGQAQVEIVDLAGRRVRWATRAGDARAGSWEWRGEDDGGRSLPAGVYFVRVRDGAGQVAKSSVVLIR